MPLVPSGTAVKAATETLQLVTSAESLKNGARPHLGQCLFKSTVVLGVGVIKTPLKALLKTKPGLITMHKISTKSLCCQLCKNPHICKCRALLKVLVVLPQATFLSWLRQRCIAQVNGFLWTE